MNVRRDADVFIKNRQFLKELRNMELRGRITRQQLLTLRGLALSGDDAGARKGLKKILGGK